MRLEGSTKSVGHPSLASHLGPKLRTGVERTGMPPAARAPAQAMIHEAMLPLMTIAMP